MKNIAKTIITATLLATCVTAGAQKYDDIYKAMPDMTLDQQFTALMKFQKANPYFSNTYIQLGYVAEQKLFGSDALREIATMRYWAENARLFYGNLKVFYKEGDVRSEYYANLNIPHTEKKPTDADLWAFVDEHSAKCNNHCDTLNLIFAAIEDSKANYNQCIAIYREICEEYSDSYDMLLRNDDELEAKLTKLGNSIDKSVESFEEYKRLTGLYPIEGYEQTFEYKDIETFRLDGLTNSDFFSNHFTMWNFRKWIDEYHSTFTSDIDALRSEIETINKKYEDGRAEYDKQAPQNIVLTQPYDEYFLFRLGRYDNESIVRELFAYLESTRKIIALAGDSIARNIPSATDLTNRKMRYIFRMEDLRNEASELRQELNDNIDAEKVARFADFFKKNYKGESGLRSFAESDGDYVTGVLDATAANIAAYINDLSYARSTEVDTFSTKTSALPALPLWVTEDPEAVKTKHLTTHVAYGSQGYITNVAGTLKANTKTCHVAGITSTGTTQYVSTLKNVSQVNGLYSAAEVCLVEAVRQDNPVLIVVDQKGKELYAAQTESEKLDFAEIDDLSGCIRWIAGNEQKAPAFSVTDSIGTKVWTAPLAGLETAHSAAKVTGGYVATGLTAQGNMATVFVDENGQAQAAKDILENVVEIVTSFRASASEISFIVRLKKGNYKHVVISATGERISM